MRATAPISSATQTAPSGPTVIPCGSDSRVGILVAFNYGAYDPARPPLAEQMQERFATEIMPRFDNVDPPPAALGRDLSAYIAAAADQAAAIDHRAQRAGA